MRCFVILCVLTVPVLSAPEGYQYREPAPVVEKHGLHTAGLPCKHAGTAYNFDAATTALINSQSEARIVNSKGHYIVKPNLETAASGYSPQSQSLTSGSQFGSSVVKGGSSSYQGSTNTFSSGQGYVQNGLSSGQFPAGHITPPPPVNYIPVSQIPPPPSPHQSHPVSQISPPLSVQSHGHGFNAGSSQSQGYNYNQAFGGQQQQHHHQTHNSQQHQGSPSFPVPPNHSPQPQGLSPPGPLTGVASQHSANYANQHSANFGAQHSANFGAQHSASFGAQHSANFGAQQSANFGAQQSANFGAQHSANFGAQHSTNFGAQHNDISLSSFSSTSLGANGLNGQLGSVIRETVANAPLDPYAEKHIYVHIPPEDMEGSSHQASLAAPQFLAPPKKHYKIVFIKAPSHAAPDYSQLAAAAAPKVEEKTLIYVLVKKPEEPSLDQIQELTQSLHKSSKPEVYFIKYKTQKEGEVAQNSVNIPTSVGLSTDQINITNGDSNGLIDIRAGGSVSGSIDSAAEGPKHELYGVPLQ